MSSLDKTSVLSKRWTRLWLSVPTLDFEEEDLEDVEDHLRFICMVYTVLVQRDVTPVKKFYLNIHQPSLCRYHDINNWVKAAIQRGVEHLNLWLHSIMDLPSGILGSRTLVVLKLGCLSVNTIFTNGFPSLKVLHLVEVGFSKHQYIVHLIFGCPILEELYVRDLKITSLSNDSMIIGGEFQSLNNLVSAILYSRPYIPLKWICEVKSLCLYEEFLPNFEVNCTFRNLTSLVLIIDRYNWSWFVDDVLRNCPKLQNFEISHTDYYNDRPCECERWSKPKFFPECLSTQLRTCTLREYQGWKCEHQFSKYIMQKAKVLRIMRNCSGIFSNPLAKLKIMEELSSFPRRSATCELHLNVK